MSKIIWQCPSPSSGFLRGVSVHHNPRREIALTFEFEGANEAVQRGELIFKDVVHYRATYMAALQADVIREAYDRIVDVGTSPELMGITSVMRDNGRQAQVRHYRICFDDGPCFDVIASSFESKMTRQTNQ